MFFSEYSKQLTWHKLMTWKILYLMSERLVSLGIMGDQLRAPQTPQYDNDIMYGDFRGASIGLSDSYRCGR